MLAPGTEAPEGSTTVPRISVDVVCGKAALLISSRNSETILSFKVHLAKRSEFGYLVYADWRTLAGLRRSTSRIR